jgi:hypothetical protein
MKKLVRVPDDRVVSFPRTTRARRVSDGATVAIAGPADGPIDVEVDRFVRGRLRVADLVEVETAQAPAAPTAEAPPATEVAVDVVATKAKPVPAPLPGVAPSAKVTAPKAPKES